MSIVTACRECGVVGSSRSARVSRTIARKKSRRDSKPILERAINTALESLESRTMMTTAPAQPDWVRSIVGNSSVINLSWTDKSDNEKLFKIERTDTTSNTVKTISVGANVTSFHDTKITPTHSYSYRVDAENEAGASAWVIAIPFPTVPTDAPAIPLNLKAAAGSISTTGPSWNIHLAWRDTSAQDEDGFEYEMSDSNTFGTILATGATGQNIAYATINGVAGDVTRYFRVRSTRSGHPSSDWSNVASLTTGHIEVAAATNFTAVASTIDSSNAASINLAWTDNSIDTTSFHTQDMGEDGYEIKYGTDPTLTTGTSTVTTGANVTLKNIGSLVADTTYYFSIRALSSVYGNGAWSSIINAHTLSATPTAPVGTKAIAGQPGEINVTWGDTSNNETNFKIERSTSSTYSGAQVVGTVVAGVTKFTDNSSNAISSFTNGTTYYYRVRAVNGSLNSAYNNANGSASAPTSLSTSATNAPALAPLTITTVAATSTAINLSWTRRDNSAQIGSYEIWRSTNGGTYTLLTYLSISPTQTYALDDDNGSGLNNANTYSYKIRAVKPSLSPDVLKYSSFSGVGSTIPLNLAPLAPSTPVVVPAGPHTLNILWTNNANNQAGFKVQYQSGATWITLAAQGSGVPSGYSTNADTTSYHDDGLTAGTSRTYRIIAANSAGGGTSTGTGNATTTSNAPAAATNLTMVATQPNEMVMFWTNNANNDNGADLYADGISGSTFLDHVDANDTFYIIPTAGSAITTLAPSTLLFGRVIMTGDDNNSGYSNSANDTTPSGIPATPSLATPVPGNCHLMNVSWTDYANNATGYELQRDAGAGFVKIATLAPHSTFYADTDVESNHTYSYRLRALNPIYGNSVFTTGISHTTPTEADCHDTTPDLTATPAGSEDVDPDNTCKNCGQSANSTDGGTRAFDGLINYCNNNFSSGGLDGWGQDWTWSNQGSRSNGVNGNGSVIAQQPHLVRDGTSLILIKSGSKAAWFDSTGTNTWADRFYGRNTITHDTANKQFIIADSQGNLLRLNDFDVDLLPAQQGQFKSFTGNSGSTISVYSYTADGNIKEVRHSTTGVIESYLYTYLPNGDANAGNIATATLRRSTNGGSSWTTVRTTEYAYYDGEEEHGTLGDLKKAVVKNAAGQVIDTSYFRYYTGEAGGYGGGMKYIFNPQSYGRLAAAFADPEAASDAQVAEFADNYFEYDDQQRVTKEIAQGAGCSCASEGGHGTFTYSYETSANADGFNSWKYKTTETLPDGNQRIILANYVGETMADVFVETSSGDKWITAYVYDSKGRQILMANPSAVTGYDETKADLFDKVGSNYQFLRDNAGKFFVTDYYNSTTATDSTVGGVEDYVEDTKIKRGETGTAILQSSMDYIAPNTTDANGFYTSSFTVYSATNGTGGRTTTYDYDFDGVTLLSTITTLPTVTTGQNGPDSPDVSEDFFDEFGRVIWSKDADGFINHYEYDPATGAMTLSIVNVKYSSLTGPQQTSFDLTGWAHPTNGLQLKTTYDVDDLGRDTIITDPNSNVTFMTYNDPDHSMRTYRGWHSVGGNNFAPTGPVSVSREDRAGSYDETLTYAYTPTSASTPTGTDTIANLQTLSRSLRSNANQLTESDRYFDLTGLSYSTGSFRLSGATVNTNFYGTTYAYDDRGRQNHVNNGNGTITDNFFDGLGRGISTWVGTDDTSTDPDEHWEPGVHAASGTNNMVKIADYTYDNGGVGDSNLTSTVSHPGGSEADRESDMFYDWRNRMVASKSGVQTTEDSTTHRPISYTVFNNLDEPTERDMYDGDGVTITTTSGVPDAPSASLLRVKTTSDYDNQSRVFATHTFSVNPSNGSVSSASIDSNIWRDHRGHVIKNQNAGRAASKGVFDGAGRLTTSYVTDAGGDTDWSDAGNVTGDIVLTQNETTYDDNSNAIFSKSKVRFHNASGTGELGDATTGPEARVSFASMYYDAADRMTDMVDVGTFGGSNYTRNSTVPTRSDSVHVTSTTYNAAGWVDTTTDPRGIIAKNFYDAAGRTTKTIGAFTDGTPTDSTNQTAEFTYDGVDHITSVNAILPGSTHQNTAYVYGISTSVIHNNDLLARIEFPDKSTGDPSTSASDQKTYTFNALGEQTSYKDQNGTTHDYDRDVLGRTTKDSVTLAAGNPQNVNDDVMEVDYAYNTQGNLFQMTSRDGSSNITNQDRRIFNGLGQLATEFQEHSGAVNTGTSAKTEFTYGTLANGSRITSMTYPNGRVLNYEYGTTGGLNDSISRIQSLVDDDVDNTVLEGYEYLGDGTVVERTHPQSSVNQTFIDASSTSTGGDQYTFDSFNRIERLKWTKGMTATDDFEYGYDRIGNVLFKNNLLQSDMSELYHASGSGNGYDNLNRLTGFERGELNGAKDSVTTPSTLASHSQSWDLDALGNWNSQTTDGAAPVDRTHNSQNELTAVGSNGLTFDNNGNTTTDEQGNTFTYDAWNRLKTGMSPSSTVLVSKTYDGQGWVTSETHGSTTTDLFYSPQWQVIEEQESDNTTKQYVWSNAYIDAVVERDRDTDNDGILDERLYSQQDANENTTAYVDTSGVVQERVVEDPYGNHTFLHADWTPVSGNVSNFDWQYLHQGGRFDFTTELYNFRKRDYDPTLGRWLQRDSLGSFDPGIAYVAFGNSPQVKVDPLGLTPFVGAFSGVNQEANYVQDYVNRLHAADVQNQAAAPIPQAVNRFSAPSRLGSGDNYPPERNILNLGSKRMLDAEARAIANRLVLPNLFCGNRRGRTPVNVLMIAPKTATLPPNGDRCCCDIHIHTVFSLSDQVPNQEVGAADDTDFWARWGDVTTVRTTGQPGQGVYGPHFLENFVDRNLDVQAQVEIGRDRWRRPIMGWRPNGQTFNVEQWIRDHTRQQDEGYTFVCHSQGCNILMSVLNVACVRGRG